MEDIKYVQSASSNRTYVTQFIYDYLAISELCHIVHAEIFLLVAEPNDLDQVSDLLVLHDLLLRGLSSVEQLTLKMKYSILVINIIIVSNSP